MLRHYSSLLIGLQHVYWPDDVDKIVAELNKIKYHKYHGGTVDVVTHMVDESAGCYTGGRKIIHKLRAAYRDIVDESHYVWWGTFC